MAEHRYFASAEIGACRSCGDWMENIRHRLRTRAVQVKVKAHPTCQLEGRHGVVRKLRGRHTVAEQPLNDVGVARAVDSESAAAGPSTDHLHRLTPSGSGARTPGMTTTRIFSDPLQHRPSRRTCCGWWRPKPHLPCHRAVPLAVKAIRSSPALVNSPTQLRISSMNCAGIPAMPPNRSHIFGSGWRKY